jgi:hypothetical protein
MNNHLNPIMQQALAPFAPPSKVFIRADQLQEGDVLCYPGNTVVHIERLTVAQCDGAIGIHGNNDTYSTWYPPHNRVRIQSRGLSLATQ